VTAARMADRDGSSPDPSHPSMTRYVEAQRRYFSECEPWAQAGLVVDNADVERPALRSNGSWAR
jgi:uridine kinase